MLALACTLLTAVAAAALGTPQWERHGLPSVNCGPGLILNVATDDRLVISQSALRHIACSNDRLNLGVATDLKARQPIYIFLRVEGSAHFLDAAPQNGQFGMLVLPKDGVVESATKPGLAGNPFNPEKARARLDLQSQELFDWRVYARIEHGLLPGKYWLQVMFGGQPVCLPMPSPTCDTGFEVR